MLVFIFGSENDLELGSISTRGVNEIHSSTHIFPNFKEKYTEDVKFHKLIKI